MAIFYVGAEDCCKEVTEKILGSIPETPSPEQGIAVLAHAVAVEMGATAGIMVRNTAEGLRIKCWLQS